MNNVHLRNSNNTLSSLVVNQHKVYDSLFVNNPNPLIILDANLNVHRVNDALLHLIGYKEDEFAFEKLFVKDYLDITNSYIELALKGEKQVFDTVAVTKFMEQLDMNMTVIPIEVDRNIVGLFVVAADVSELKQQQLELLVMKEILNHSQTMGNTGTWDYDVIEDEAYWSNQMYSIFGLEDTENFIPTYEIFFNFVHPEDEEDLYEVINKSIALGTSFTTEFRIIRKDGTERILSQQANAILDDSGKTVRLIGTCHDITERKNTEKQLKEREKQFKKAEEKIRNIRNQDCLTKLSNRMMFDKSLAQQLIDCKKNKEKFAILYLDMDRFKNINDTLGHFVGDELIKQISGRLKEVAINERLFRIGGDEFAIILSNIKDDHYPRKIAEKINHALKPLFFIKGYELYVTTSIGISIYPISGEDEETLLKSATTALARAKQWGNNNIQIHTTKPDNESYKRYYLETEMRKALENKQFEVYYQPRVCVKTGALLSAEALIRWKHPEWGIVSPVDFIPLAEESSFIHEIDKFVITTVCKQLKEWQHNHLTVIPISVNVSAKSFFRNDLVSNIVAIFQKANIHADLLELEITESSFLHNIDKVIEILSELKQYGIKVALDDFGTGYSSLTHLKKLNIDTIKIDRSFIQNITESNEDATITSCIIQLAHGLTIDVVAEGVETKEQLQWLREKSCQQIQGYLFCKPISTTEFTLILEKGHLEVK